MPFTYHPPTRRTCHVCEKNLKLNPKPIIDTHNGRASSANNFPFHNWYNFVLGYSPEFPNFVLKRENINPNDFVVDPFLGSGTTMVSCKLSGIKSAGVEANDFFKFAATVKLDWDIEIKVLKEISNKLLVNIEKAYSKFDWSKVTDQKQLTFNKSGNKNPFNYSKKNRPKALTEKYISDIPFVKLDLIKKEIEKIKFTSKNIRAFFLLAHSASILPSSNVKYGPGFGVSKPKKDVDVLDIFNSRLKRMILDLESISNKNLVNTNSDVILGDSRKISNYFKQNSIDLMITSPPYPGDHEYTKHSRLELIFNELASDLKEFRIIKKRMLRGSTTNIYKEDHEGHEIKDLKSIQKIVLEIDKRLKEDNATSGFEKLYTKLIWEYFGGMYKVFQEALIVLKPGAKFHLLVSDSHAFKMVHIETAKLLSELAVKAGFVNCKIELWQYKISTSHRYKLFENILSIQKPIEIDK